MKRNIYFTADLHFGHGNIIKYCNRPFADIYEMNDYLIRTWNHYIRPVDIVYVLGDVGFNTDLKEIIPKLNGIKILILGNHDQKGPLSYYNLGFNAVMHAATIKIGKRTVTLSHRPRRSVRETLRLCWLYMFNDHKNRSFKQKFNLVKKEWRLSRAHGKNYHLCGHVHNAWKTMGKNINVGVDVWNFKPVSTGEVLKLIDGGK